MSLETKKSFSRRLSLEKLKKNFLYKKPLLFMSWYAVNNFLLSLPTSCGSNVFHFHLHTPCIRNHFICNYISSTQPEQPYQSGESAYNIDSALWFKFYSCSKARSLSMAPLPFQTSFKLASSDSAPVQLTMRKACLLSLTKMVTRPAPVTDIHIDYTTSNVLTEWRAENLSNDRRIIGKWFVFQARGLSRIAIHSSVLW